MHLADQGVSRVAAEYHEREQASPEHPADSKSASPPKKGPRATKYVPDSVLESSARRCCRGPLFGVLALDPWQDWAARDLFEAQAHTHNGRHTISDRRTHPNSQKHALTQTHSDTLTYKDTHKDRHAKKIRAFHAEIQTRRVTDTEAHNQTSALAHMQMLARAHMQKQTRAQTQFAQNTEATNACHVAAVAIEHTAAASHGRHDGSRLSGCRCHGGSRLSADAASHRGGRRSLSTSGRTPGHMQHQLYAPEDSG